MDKRTVAGGAALLASLAAAGTTIAKVETWKDAVAIVADSLRYETARRGANNKTLAPRATEIRKFAIRLDSIIQVSDSQVTADTIPLPPIDSTPVPPPPPPTAGPTAVFTISCTETVCTLDGTPSTGKIVSYLWDPNDPERPKKSTPIITRNNTGSVSLEWNETLTVTDSAGNKASVTQHVKFAAPAPPPPNPNPPPGPTPTPTGSVTRAAQPQTFLTFTTPAVKRTLRVQVTGNLQAALDSSVRGDEILLPAGAIFTGNFVMKPKPGTVTDGWVTIRSNGTLQPRGVRAGPGDAPQMAKIISGTADPALSTVNSASGWWIDGVEVTTSAPLNYGLVNLGDGATSGPQKTLAVVPSDIAVVRSYIHGTGSGGLSRCIGLNSARTEISDNFLYDCHGKGFDTQAIGGWNGPGPFKIVNNMLAGAGENVMFGGADPAIVGLIPSDIEFRRNYVYTPPTWKGVFTKKNLFELKNAQRVLMEGNVFDGSWADAQTGGAILLKSTNQSGGCRWCAVMDVTVRRNLIRNAAFVFGLSAKDPGVVDSLGRRWTMEENWAENINVAPFTGDAKMIQLFNNVADVILSKNVFVTTTMQNAFVVGDACQVAATNLDWTKNVFSLGTYGIFSSCGAGESAFTHVVGTVLISGGIVGPVVGGYPSHQFYPTVDNAIAAGHGIPRSVVDAATQGVTIIRQ